MIFPPRKTWPVSFGFAGSEMSYCLTSPCSQQEKYRYLSSKEINMSDIRPTVKNLIEMSCCDEILLSNSAH